VRKLVFQLAALGLMGVSCSAKAPAPVRAAAGVMSGSSGVASHASVLDLGNWKLTLPIGEPEHPREIKPPALASFEMLPYFHVDSASHAVVFRAPAGGVTTSGSNYPRCELREMTNAGADKAAWSTNSGSHSMTIRQAITHLPLVKPHLAAGQIHDGDSDVVMIRLERSHLFVEGDGQHLGDLTSSYQLGTPFTVRITASAGIIKVYYNDLHTPKVELPSRASGCYFKAGAYTLSNPERGDDAAAYGEVAIYELEVTHE
jgi:hypothetical protein